MLSSVCLLEQPSQLSLVQPELLHDFSAIFIYLVDYIYRVS
jgi:hypothetical protein